MARRSRDRQDQLQQQSVQVERRFRNTPLAAIGEILSVTITDVQRSTEAGGTPTQSSEGLASYVAGVLELLPSSFGDRFEFDAQLIGTLAAEYSSGDVKLSGMLVPKPSEAWGHQTVSMPSTDGKNAHVIDVLHLPGDDNLADVDLLDYPFICHELGHNILFRNGDEFIESFREQLDAVLSSIARQSLAIRGSAKHVADETAAKVRAYWTPTSHQYNWAHEIAVDVIALWLCGPAYLAALQDVMEADGLNPFQLGQSHPPYDVRARALLDAAGQLGWAYYSGDIYTLVDGWSSPTRSGEKTNLHVACADLRLIKAAVAVALQACRLLSLPLCTPAGVQVIDEAQKRGDPIDFGTNLIIAAWAARNRLTPKEYITWEQLIIRGLLEDIRA